MKHTDKERLDWLCFKNADRAHRFDSTEDFVLNYYAMKYRSLRQAIDAAINSERRGEK